MFSLSNVRIGTKLGVMSGIGILLTFGLSAAIIVGNAKVKSANDLAELQKDISFELTKIQGDFVAVRLNVRNIRLARNMAEFKKAGSLEAKKAGLEKQFTRMLPKFNSDEDRARAKDIQSGINAYIDHAIQRTVPAKLAALKADPKDLARMKATYDETQRIQFEDLDPIGDKAVAAATAASRVAKAHADKAIVDAEQAMQSSEFLSVGASVVVVLVLIGSALIALLSVAKPLSALAGLLQRMAKGEEVEITGTERKDEIGQTARAVNEIGEMLAEKARREAEEKAVADREKARQEADLAARSAEERAEQEKRTAAERDAAMQKAADEFQAAVGGIVNAAVAGDFSQRVDLNGKTGLVMNVGTAINSMCENVAMALDDLVGMLNALAEGDLTKRITAHYEGSFALLKDNANKTAERIGSTVGDIKAVAREVTNASMEITTSTIDLSQRTEEQAASLEETSASMEEIAATVKQNAGNAQQANQSAISTRDVANRGGQVVAQAVTAMAQIEESSRNISEIIGVIDEIARQTNLLALNAAVEAARAGDAGRGFAVVASEVRSLAQRSSQAAKDIKDLIVNSSGQVKDGVELVNRAGTALNEITESIKQVADLVSDIATASVEQSTGIDEVNKALTQMDEVTQQNSALVEENAATAKTLESQAKALDERITFFRIDERGSAGGAQARKFGAAPAVSLPAHKAPALQPEAAAPARGNGPPRNPIRKMQTALAEAWKDF